jgi:hypothetical protein
MADPWIIKQHDTYPPLEAQLSDKNGVVDLTNAASARLLRQPTPAGALQDLPMTFKSPRTSGFVVRDWATGDNAAAGTYSCEVEVTWNDGKITTFPNDGTFTIKVEADLG